MSESMCMASVYMNASMCLVSVCMSASLCGVHVYEYDLVCGDMRMSTSMCVMNMNEYVYEYSGALHIICEGSTWDQEHPSFLLIVSWLPTN